MKLYFITRHERFMFSSMTDTIEYFHNSYFVDNGFGLDRSQITDTSIAKLELRRDLVTTKA